jgi:hypothetical protein
MDESAMGSTLRRARIVSGEDFCTTDREMGLVAEPDERGNPVSLWMLYRPPPGMDDLSRRFRNRAAHATLTSRPLRATSIAVASRPDG